MEQFHSAFQFHVLLSELLQLFVLGARVSRSRVFLDGFHVGLCQEFIQVLAVGEDGVVVNVVYVCVVVALELSVDGLVEGGQLVGEKVPTGAVLTLMVGDGGALKADSLGVDSVGGTVEPVLSEDSAADESWF